MNRYFISYLGELRTECVHEESGAKLQTDAPKDNCGKGEAFSPTDLLAVSLGSCILTLLGITAKKYKFELEDVSAVVEKEMTTHPPRRIARIRVEVFSSLNADETMRQRLETAALTCPVFNSLHPEIKKEISFTWGEKCATRN